MGMARSFFMSYVNIGVVFIYKKNNILVKYTAIYTPITKNVFPRSYLRDLTLMQHLTRNEP